ncbi:hypothetical protein KJ656_15165, partial [bacterium]|nr:hypothetical protein [bacterium]
TPVILDTFPTPEIGHKTLAIGYISLLKYYVQSHHFLDGKHNKNPAFAGRSIRLKRTQGGRREK